MENDYSPISRMTSIGQSTTLYRSFSNNDYTQNTTERVKTSGFSPYKVNVRPTKTMVEIAIRNGFDGMIERQSTLGQTTLKGSQKLMKQDPTNLVDELLLQASQINHAPFDRNTIKQLSFKLSPVSDIMTCKHCSVSDLLSSLGIHNPASVIASAKTAAELAAVITAQVLRRHSESTYAQATPQMANTSLTNMSTITSQAPIDRQSAASLTKEVARLKHLIHRMQNNTCAVTGVGVYEHREALKAENEDLRRKVADLIDVVKRRESEGVISLLVLGDATPRRKARRTKEVIPKSELEVRKDLVDWRVISEEQKVTIENLNTLVENLRYETEQMRKQLTDKCATTSFSQIDGDCRTTAMTAGEIRRKINSLKADSRCRSVAGLYN